MQNSPSNPVDTSQRNIQVNISLSAKTDQDIIDFWNSMSKGVRSNYFRKLIRQDMNKESIENKIRRIVSEELAKGGNDNSGIKNALRGLFDYE